MLRSVARFAKIKRIFTYLFPKNLASNHSTFEHPFGVQIHFRDENIDSDDIARFFQV